MAPDHAAAVNGLPRIHADPFDWPIPHAERVAAYSPHFILV